MHLGTFGLAIALVAVIVIAVPGLCVETSNPQTAIESSSNVTTVDNETWQLFVDEPDQHFQKARESFLKKDLDTAATQIRKSAAFLKLEVGRATKEGKDVLADSIAELEKLADGVEGRTVTSVNKIDDAFARAEHALAKHHYLKASESWAKKEIKNSGQELKAATFHLERSLAWAEYKTGTVVNDIRSLAGKLIRGTGWVSEEVNKGMDALVGEIEILGKKIRPAK